jgi:processive 1,2-diacylglycerol beta-glucosyltransferase
MMAHALILSGSIGAGHDAVASACAGALRRSGVTCETLDCMALLGGRGRRAAEAIFRRAIEVGPLYDAFHFSHLRGASPFARRLEKQAARRLLLGLEACMPPGEDLGVLAVFATGAGVAGRLREAGRARRGAVAVVTDAAAHAMWIHPGLDGYVVFSEMAAGTVRQYAPRATVVVIDPPVRPGFASPPSKSEARASLGIDDDGPPVVLVMGGAWGRGPLGLVARRLWADGLRVVVLPGANAQLSATLAQARFPMAHPMAPPPRVLGPHDDVCRAMAAADVVVTAPGQSCSEARAVGRPLVVVDAVPGHGRENLLLELARGGALASPPRPAEVAAAVAAALDDRAQPAPHGGKGAWADQFLAALERVVGP